MIWMQTAPILLVGAAILAALAAAHELALRVGRHIAGKTKRSEARGYLVSSALALLGLLMAFTFSAAQDRFRLREQLVIDEANAIGTTYLRFQLLDPPFRQALSSCLLGYAEMRVKAAQADSPAEVEANARQAAVFQDRIWRTLVGATRANPVQTLNPPLVQSVNETFDLAASRRAAREMKVPSAILRVLLISSPTVAALVGYTEAGERRETGVLLGILVLLTLAFSLILDLDSPSAGVVRVSGAPLLRAVEDLRRAEARHPQACAVPPPA